MLFKINGIEPKVIKVDDNGTVTDLKKLYIIKNGEKTCCWTKPYTLTISKGSHSNVLVESKLSAYSTGTIISSGSAIYHGRYLEITITGQQGYSVSWKLNGVTQSSPNVTIQVTGDIAISVTETATVVSLNKPIISGSYSYDSYMGFYYLSYKLTNTNARAVVASILVYGDGDRLDGSYSKNISANSTETIHHGEMYCNGAKVCVTYSCSGYGDSSNSTTFGNYKGSGSTNDETTSTAS